MRDAAATEGTTLRLLYAFRSVDYQRSLIEERIQQYESIESIFTLFAVPGFSEHHTGRALDIEDDSGTELDQRFANTEAYGWLCQNASRYGFRLSYPADNSFGIRFEPWHWFYTGESAD